MKISNTYSKALKERLKYENKLVQPQNTHKLGDSATLAGS